MDLDPFGRAGVPVVGSHLLVWVARFVEQPRDRLVVDDRRPTEDPAVPASPRAVQVAAPVADERPAAASAVGDDDARMAIPPRPETASATTFSASSGTESSSAT
jgi:hypothetical protein